MKSILALFKPSKAEIKALKVIVKSTFKAGITALAGFITYKLGANPEISVLVAMVFAPILKFIDPKDDSLGINKA